MTHDRCQTEDGRMAKASYLVVSTICSLSSVIQIASHRRKDRAEHVRSQHAGVGVVTRAVIAVEQREPVGRVLCAVAERQGGKGAAERRHGTVVGDATQENERRDRKSVV